MWFTLVVMAALVLHFSFTLVYSVPALKVPQTLRDKSYTYSYPFFHQTWSVFAPNLPEYSTQLEFRVYRNDAWTEYTDATAALGTKGGHTAETIEQAMCSGLAYQLANNMFASHGRLDLQHVVESKSYGRAIYFVHAIGRRMYGSPVGDSLQMRLQFRFTPSPDQARNYQYSTFVFPSYALPKVEVRP